MDRQTGGWDFQFPFLLCDGEQQGRKTKGITRSLKLEFVQKTKKQQTISCRSSFYNYFVNVIDKTTHVMTYCQQRDKQIYLKQIS